jgi:Flp pilus assembly protein TadB
MNAREQFSVIAGVLSVAAGMILTDLWGLTTLLSAIPALILLPVAVYVSMSEHKTACSPEVMLNEAPTVIGMMSVSLRSNGSLDSAVRDVAANGPKNIASLFAGIVRDADCRRTDGINQGLLDLLSSLPSQLSPFRRAVHMLITAADTSDGVRRSEMIGDAEETVLTGLRLMGESYSSKLSTPCMLIFGLGIMLPMILVSIMPIMGMGSGMALDPTSVAFITLILIPALVAFAVMSIRSRNPFAGNASGKPWKYTITMMAAVPLVLVCMESGMGITECITFPFGLAGALTAAAVYPKVAAETKRKRSEASLRDALFDLGNRLISGENYESALVGSLSARKDCARIAGSLSREMVLCRGDTASAISMALSSVSPFLASKYADVQRASEKDLRESGRLAVSVAHQLQDQEGIRNGIENKLKSTLDMMTGTASVFAPLILGMSMMMLAPISEMTGSSGMSGIAGILPIYLVMLAALISVLTPALTSRGGPDTVFRFGLMVPISLTIFYVLSQMSV